MPIDSITPLHKMPTQEDESIDVNAIEPVLNTEFEENVPQHKGIIHEVYDRPG